MISSTRLLELMSSRMFHDLAGPIGAVNNSLEFLEEENPIIKEKATSLMKSSASEAVIRLKYFRQAYGTIGDKETHTISIHNLIKDLIKSTKVKLEWKIEEDVIGSYLGKVLLNLNIIAMNALIQGGVITYTKDENGYVINCEGNMIIFSEETGYLLSGDCKYVQFTSTNIQPYYTYLMLKEAQVNLALDKTSNQLKFFLKT